MFFRKLLVRDVIVFPRHDDDLSGIPGVRQDILRGLASLGVERILLLRLAVVIGGGIRNNGQAPALRGRLDRLDGMLGDGEYCRRLFPMSEQRFRRAPTEILLGERLGALLPYSAQESPNPHNS